MPPVIAMDVRFKLLNSLLVREEISSHVVTINLSRENTHNNLNSFNDREQVEEYAKEDYQSYTWNS